LPGYTLYRIVVAEHEGNAHWEEWRPEFRTYTSAETWLASHPERERLEALREGHAFIQWIGRRQWLAVRAHADEKGVLLMGEMSFGVSKSSADVWCQPNLFDVEWSMGTRPVSYFETNKDSERWGQNWGLPPYRWENHRSENFAWLRGRVQTEALFFHICRLDHLRGYFRAYMFPWQGGVQHGEFATLTEEEARLRTGGRMPRFVPGPDDDETTAQMNDLQGREIIKVIQEAAGGMGLFAEIMGAMPAFMRKAIEDLQVPNLTFPLLEKNAEGGLLPEDAFRELSLISYSNHDHAPLAALYLQMHEKIKADHSSPAAQDLRNLLDFAGWTDAPPETLTGELLSALQKALFSSPCRLAVLMSSDLLGTTQRFNLPGSYGSETWCERLELPFAELERHPVYGPRIATAEKWVVETGREPVAQPLMAGP
jgi:4-alpha-glucanotransferase